MNTAEQVNELEKNRRLSARAITVYACLLSAAAVALWVLGNYVTIPWWLTAVVLGMTAFTLLGDIYNYFYCGRRLRMLKRDAAT